MRLYNATSCTPCCSTWEGATRRRPEPRSFVPPQMDHTDNRTHHTHVYQRHLQRDRIEPSSSFQKLSENPSSSTSTTGGLTPPFDNTGASSPLSSQRSDAENRTHATKQEPGSIPNQAKSERLVSQPIIAQPQLTQPARLAPNMPTRDYYHGKHLPAQQECLGITDLDITEDDDMESSCSTLTTTRSMMLQQQQECTITVSSISQSQQAEVNTSDLHSNPAAERSSNRDLPPLRSDHSKKNLRMGLESKNGRTENFAFNESVSNLRSKDVDLAPSVVASTNMNGASKAKRLLRVGNMKVHSSREMPVKESPPFTATLHQGNAPARSAAIAGISVVGNKENAGRHMQSITTVDDNDDFVAVKARLRKVTIVRPDHVEFFPLQIPTDSLNNPSSSEVLIPPRLGVTTRFPSMQRQPLETPKVVTTRFPSMQQQPIETPKGNVEKYWDPLHDDFVDPPSTSSIDDGGQMSWATFESREDLGYPSLNDGFDDTDSPFFPLHDQNHVSCVETNDTSALLAFQKKGDKGTPEVSLSTRPSSEQDRSDVATSKYQDPKIHRDTRKIFARRRGEGAKTQTRQPRDFLQKPKLLGPLLEARFTRSYWQRLKHANNDGHSTTMPQIGMGENNDLSKVDAMKRSTKAMTDGVEIIAPAEPQSANKVLKATSATKPNKERCESKAKWFDQEPSVSESDYENATSKGDKERTSADDSVSAIRVLSPRRVSECDTVLDGIALETNHILSAIDVADASSPLTLKQILSLRSLVPTPVEERMLLQYVKSGRKSSSAVDIPSKGEMFMFQMTRIRDARRKLGAMMFQLEFAGVVEVMNAECRLVQVACDEVMKSQRLEKVLGIVNMLRNRLVGKIPSQKRTSMTSFASLVSMLDEAEPYFNGPKVNQPFLHHACSRIQKNKPSLLRLREEMPSLRLAIEGTSWNSLQRDLEQLEEKFDAFRKFAVSISVKHCDPKNTRLPHALTVQDEIDVLQTTSIGSFVGDACLRMAELYKIFDSTQNATDALALHFTEQRDEKPDVTKILETVIRFCTYAERFISD